MRFKFSFEIRQRALSLDGSVDIIEASEEKARAYVESLFAEKARIRLTRQDALQDWDKCED